MLYIQRNAEIRFPLPDFPHLPPDLVEKYEKVELKLNTFSYVYINRIKRNKMK